MPDGRQRHDFGDWPATLGQVAAIAPRQMDIPDWARAPAPEPRRPLDLVSPSDLGGAKALPGEAGLDADLAKTEGTALHLLLEHLPDVDPASREAIAAALVPDASLRTSVLPQVLAILADDALAHIFGPHTLAELALTADLDGHRLVGTVDRLVVTDDHILAVDFKSNRVVPDHADKVPDGILAQMGAYAEALAQIYPDRRVEVAVLWTTVPRLMHLDRDIVRAALQSATKA
jgi:ATP-dependent helicase/nuclease subunit A